MIISKHPQGSIEWMQARAGIPTASEFDNLVTPKWEVRTGQMPKTYLARKLAEWWQGGRTFLAEVRNELKRVTWPSRKEVYATTVVVILVSFFFGVYLWGVDMVVSHAVQWIFSQFGGAA